MTDASQRQTPPVLRQDITRLDQQYRNVRYDPDTRAVVLDAELGSGWTPRVITIRILIPEQYPHAAPRVALPWTLRCHGVVPRHMLLSGQYLVRGQLGDNILYYPKWESTQTLRRLVDTLVTDLNTLCGPDGPRREVDA